MKLWEIGSIIGGKWRDLKAEEKKEYQDAWNLDKVRILSQQLSAVIPESCFRVRYS